MPEGVDTTVADPAAEAGSAAYEVVALDDVRALVAEVAGDAASAAAESVAGAPGEVTGVVAVDAAQWDWLSGCMRWQLAATVLAAALLGLVLGAVLARHLVEGWR